MSTNRWFLRGLLVLGTAGLLAGHGAVRAGDRSDPAQANTGRGGIRLWESPSAGGSATTGNIMSGNATLRRATKLLGEPLKNTQGAKLGTISDLVLTSELDQVSYAVVSRGGLLGIGKRMYAVPWSALRAGVGDTVVAPINELELDQDRGFGAKQWPAEGDPRWLSRAGERTEQVTFDVQHPAEQKEIRRRRVSHVLGMAARGPDNSRIGRVKDIMIAMDTGDIPFTIVSYGGLLGIGNKYTAVPAGIVDLRPADYVARIEANEQVLHANAFDPRNFPDLSDPVYTQRLYATYTAGQAGPGSTVLGYVPAEEPARPQPAQPRTIPGLQVPQTPAPSPIPGEYLAVFTPDNLRTIEGVVTGVSTFQLVGTNAEWVQLQVRADDGSLVTVHLGPRDYVSRQDFYVAANDRIIVMGAQATAWRQPIILPITATVAGRTINLRDQTGKPLWDVMTQPQPQSQTPPETQPPAQPETQTPAQPETQAPAQPATEAPAQPETQPQAQPQEGQSPPVP